MFLYTPSCKRGRKKRKYRNNPCMVKCYVMFCSILVRELEAVDDPFGIKTDQLVFSEDSMCSNPFDVSYEVLPPCYSFPSFSRSEEYLRGVFTLCVRCEFNII